MGWRGETMAAIVDAPGTVPAVVIEGAGTVAWCHAAGGATECLLARCRATTSGRFRAHGRVSPVRSARCLPEVLPLASGALPAVAVSFVGHAPGPVERRALLAEAHRALAADGVLALLDHSRPRRRLVALAALVRRPFIAGATPGARWRRLAYPAAREVQAAGFTVRRLRLVAGERLQVVVAAKSPSSRGNAERFLHGAG